MESLKTKRRKMKRSMKKLLVSKLAATESSILLG